MLAEIGRGSSLIPGEPHRNIVLQLIPLRSCHHFDGLRARGDARRLPRDRHGPIHYDAQLAARTRFGGIVVQGGITSAILNAVVAEDLPGPGTVFLHVDWSFKAPVRPGETITGEVEVTRVREDKPITELATRVVRDDGTVVLEGTAVCYTMPLGEAGT